jgi:hypothetical protein
LQWLLAAGDSSVTEVDEAGNINTPLLLATKEEHFAMSHWLLEFGGSDINIQFKRQITKARRFGIF